MMRPWLVVLGLWLPSLALATGPEPASALAVQQLYQIWAVPQANLLMQQSTQLQAALQDLCTTPDASAARLQAARQRWSGTLAAWEGLAAVAIGPVLSRRSQRQIDFNPTRPRLIVQAIQKAPADLAALEWIGTPAKGLPALEWLLWVEPVQAQTPACRYAGLLAAEIRVEADALHTALQTLAATPPDPVGTATALSEWVNQWVGGLERLRWQQLEMPVRVARTAVPATAPEWPRAASQVTVRAWLAQWDSLRTLATGPVGLGPLLDKLGHAAQATALNKAVAGADTRMQALRTTDADQVLAAAAALAMLKHCVENEVAPALGVNIGFSDADGD